MLLEAKVIEIKKNLSNDPRFKVQASYAKCLGDPNCLKILYILSTEKYVCPSDFSEILDVSMPAISHQLSRLKQMEIVDTVRHGQKICYFMTETRESKLIAKVVKTLIETTE